MSLSRLLLHAGPLSSLWLNNGDTRLLDVAAAPAFGAALRACHLSSLRLCNLRLWLRPAMGDSVVTALAGHPTVRVLSLWGNPVAGAWLG